MTTSPRVVGFVVAALLATAAPLSGQSIHFAGSTTGCFFRTGTCTPTSTAGVGGLRFIGGTFDASTVNGSLVLGESSNNLGWFQLGPKAVNYAGNFLLNVTFTQPNLLGADALVSAAISGSVKKNSGGVTIDFADESESYRFSGADLSGSMRMTVSDVSLTTGVNHLVPIGGTIDATVTPEPATLTLIATGLVGLIPAARRRRLKKS